jgi:hypothetical protein
MQRSAYGSRFCQQKWLPLIIFEILLYYPATDQLNLYDLRRLESVNQDLSVILFIVLADLNLKTIYEG